MLQNTGFSPRDWELAPRYSSPVAERGVVILDFETLRGLAEKEESIGSFRQTADGTLASAPLYVDELPAAFYRVATAHPQFTPNRNTTDKETIVVVEGILKVVLNHGERTAEAETDLQNVAYEGGVLEFHDAAVSMQAIGLVDPARCLALALYRDEDRQIVSV